MAIKFQNAVLRKLSNAAIDALKLQRVDFSTGQSIYEAYQPAEYAYFPECGVLSVVSQLEEGRNIEVETIGDESMAGSFFALNLSSLPFKTFVQVPGFGYRAAVSSLIAAMEQSLDVRKAVVRAEAVLRIQSMQNAACNGMHSVEQRCCRWLLMSRDRVNSDEVRLTHEFLAEMLGVRRASVSDVLGPLQTAGTIRSGRGVITILDRAALEARVCECYHRISREEH